MLVGRRGSGDASAGQVRFESIGSHAASSKKGGFRRRTPAPLHNGRFFTAALVFRHFDLQSYIL
jgi:hypothetical protein